MKTSKVKEKFILLLLSLLAFPLISLAQMTGTTMSLNEAIQYGLKHRTSMANARLDVSFYQKETQSQIRRYFPQISATGDYRNYLKLPTTILPGAIIGKPGQNIKVRFGSTNDINVGIKAEQKIFDPSLISSIQKAKVNEHLAENQIDLQKKNTELIIRQDYYSALVSREKSTLSKRNLAHYEKLLTISRSRYENKQINTFDYHQVEVRFRNQKEQVSADSLDYVNSLAQLKLDIGFPAEQTLQLGDSTLIQLVRENDSDIQQASPNVQAVPELKSLQIQKNLNTQSILENRRNYLPTLSAYAFLGSQYFNDRLNLSNAQNWYGQSYIGLNLNLPIFDGLQKSADAQKLDIKRKELDNQVQNFIRQFPEQEVIGRRNIDIAMRKTRILKSDMELTEQKLMTQQKRYDLGLVQLNELLNTEIQYSNDQQNYQQALQNLLNAQLQYTNLTGS